MNFKFKKKSIYKQKMRSKRKITSAIPFMKVPEVRIALSSLRKKSESYKFFLCDTITYDKKGNEINIQKFAFAFIKGKHMKRFGKSKKKN